MTTNYESDKVLKCKNLGMKSTRKPFKDKEKVFGGGWKTNIVSMEHGSIPIIKEKIKHVERRKLRIQSNSH